MMTEGAGTRSYANALLRFRCGGIWLGDARVDRGVEVGEDAVLPEAQRRLVRIQIPSHICDAAVSPCSAVLSSALMIGMTRTST